MKVKTTIALTTIISILVLVGADARPFDVEQKKRAKIMIKTSGLVMEGFQLSVESEKVNVRLDEAIIVRLSLKNISDRVRLLVVSTPEKDYQLVVKNGEGESVSLTEYGKRVRESSEEHIGRVVVQINPGQEVVDALEISKMYDMVKSGTYYITAQRYVVKANGKASVQVVSNTIKVTAGD